MADKIEEIMKLIGWTDGYHIPVLNEENEKLSKKIEEMLREKATYMVKADDFTNRVNALNKHVKDIKIHHQQNQAVIYSYRTYEESEDHMTKVALNDEQKIKQDILKLSNSYQETCNRSDSLENELRTLKENIEKIKNEAQFDHETLILWEKEIKRKEEDNQVIEFYVHEDDIKAKEQNLQLEKLQIQAKTKQLNLENISNDIFSQELSLEHISNLFRKMHANRQYIIQKWEACVSFMGKQDEEIIILRHDQNELRKQILQQQESLQEEEHFLESLERNNRETELKTRSLDREANLLLKLKDKISEQLDVINNEVNIAQRNLANVGKQVEQERRKYKFMVKEITDMNKRIEQLKKVVENLERQLKSVQMDRLSAHDRTAQMEEILQAEETHLKDIEIELKNVQDNIFRNQNTLKELKEKGNCLISVAKGIESSMKISANEKLAIGKKLSQKFQFIYHVDYLIQKQESRIARMMGKQESSKKIEIENKIKNLESVLESKQADYKFLSSQKAKLEDEERRLLSIMESNNDELKRLESRKDNELMSMNLMAKRLRECLDENRNLQVEENVMRLKISKMQSAISREGKEIFSLEKEQLELDMAMQERKLEIMMEKEVLEMKCRASSEEVSLLRQEVKHMENRISQLKKRYEICIARFGQEDDVSEEPISLIRFNLKIAQEKQELQEEGDKLEKQIQKAEKEICAMEATLMIISGTNEAYKCNLTCVDEEAPGLLEKRDLETKLQMQLEYRRNKNLELTELQNELSTLMDKIKELDGQISEIASALKEETVLSNSLTIEIQDQSLKQTRAEQQAKRLQGEVRRIMGTASTGQATFDERDYYLRQLTVANKNSLVLLVQLIDQNPEMGPRVEQLIEEKGLTKALESSKALQKQRSQGSITQQHQCRSSLTSLSPKLMPPVNTPASSPDRYKDQAGQKSLVATKTKTSPKAASSGSPTLLNIDGTLFSEGNGRSSGSYKGIVPHKMKLTRKP